MEFYIFSKSERVVKPIIFLAVIVSTISLIYGFFAIDHDRTIFTIYTFVAPVVYSLLLFIFGILLEKEKQSVEEKLYERECYYLTLKKLKSVTNCVFNNIYCKDYDLVAIKRGIDWFQLFTGRFDVSNLNTNEKPPVIVRENGFVYSSKMKKLETAALTYIDENKNNTSKPKAKPIKRLLKYYAHCTKKLDDNIIRLEKTYRGKLQHLIDYEEFISLNETKFDDIISNTEDIQRQLDDSLSSAYETSEKIDAIKEEIYDLYEWLQDYLDDIEDWPHQ